MPKLIWTDHAIDRVAERIGFRPDIEIPERQLLETGALVEVGTIFRQRIGPVIYICKRDSPGRVLIITVISSDVEHNRYNQNENNHSRKPKRIYAGRREFRYEECD